MTQHFTDAILTAAKASIPQSSGTARLPQFHGGIRTAQLASEPRNEHWLCSNATLPWAVS